MTTKIASWFKDLTIVKIVVAGLILVGLLVVLSPLAFIVAALVLGVGVIALIAQVVQRRSLGGWAIVTGLSLALVLTLGGVSSALYGDMFAGGGAGGMDPADEANAETLMAGLAYEDPDREVVEDVEVSRTRATVYVSGDTTKAETEYVCNYVLELSHEFFEQGEWETEGRSFNTGLQEVSVKKSLGLFDMASCGW